MLNVLRVLAVVGFVADLIVGVVELAGAVRGRRAGAG